MKKLKRGGPLGMGFWQFMAPEVATFVYALFTVLIIFFTWTNLDNPSDLLWQRLHFVSGTIALWVVYLLWPCKAVIGARIAYLLFMLGVWYPDTYAINHQFPCFVVWLPAFACLLAAVQQSSGVRAYVYGLFLLLPLLRCHPRYSLLH